MGGDEGFGCAVFGYLVQRYFAVTSKDKDELFCFLLFAKFLS